MKDALPTGLRLLGVDEEDYEVLKRVVSSIGSFEEFEGEVRQMRDRLEESLLKIDVMNEVLYQLNPVVYAEAAQVVGRRRLGRE